jgi:alanine racemase
LVYSLDHIAGIIGSPIEPSDITIDHLLTDSRKLYSPPASLFFALPGPRRNGHRFIADLYNKGVRAFVVSEKQDEILYPAARFIVVENPLDALQKLVAYHRKQFNIPVIGITGSNGKTIVKEWLYQLLHQDYNIVRSPRSYNSQIGVPLSVWQMNEQHTLGIFEAGISRPGEMDKLEKIIQPTIGILTNIGAAHSEGFISIGQKEAEKKILFRNSVQPPPLQDVRTVQSPGKTSIYARTETHAAINIEIPFADEASIQNAITCCAVMLMLGYENKVIADRMRELTPVNMRLELKKGINHCSIINDSYSADISSLEIALNFLEQQGGQLRKTVILSDFLQSSLPDDQLYRLILEGLQKHKINRLIGIGEKISGILGQEKLDTGRIEMALYSSTEDFTQQFLSSQFKEETILIKGARIFEFERIVQLLEQKVHQTVLEINLNAIIHNLKVYQAQLHPGTKVMAMVKAFAYGSGGGEIASILQYHKVDYLGVAYADEGIELRKSGISLPIMVMNPEESGFDLLVEHNLDPDMYSFGMLQSFARYLQKEGLQQYPVHIELETGMNRLGFAPEEVDELAKFLQKNSSVRVQSVFSHLAASEDPAEDEFSWMQFERFKEGAKKLKETLGYSFIEHIANTAAVSRLPGTQLDMVRIGIGLYGVDSGINNQLDIQPVATLRTTIAQLKKLKEGDTVSYNRKGVITKDTLVATIRIGYADGFPRRLGYGVGKVWIKGSLAPVLGTVCMDMTMVDVTEIEGIREGDDVIIFGNNLSISQVAAWAGTIPYEIMTSISQRVKRVYFEE